ncbi:MAG: hypothetical protein ABIR19_04830 [Ginsengibacter sp.]
MANHTSRHILGPSANLPGFCLFVITSLRITSFAATSIIDEFTQVIALLPAFSCVLSFLSIRSRRDVAARS